MEIELKLIFGKDDLEKMCLEKCRLISGLPPGVWYARYALDRVEMVFDALEEQLTVTEVSASPDMPF
jgi:hypothetical protein